MADLRKMSFRIPSQKEEQEEIANILTGMDVEIDQLNKELEKYRVIKVGMMQQLLTGKIRIYYGDTK